MELEQNEEEECELRVTWTSRNRGPFDEDELRPKNRLDSAKLNSPIDAHFLFPPPRLLPEEVLVPFVDAGDDARLGVAVSEFCSFGAD